VSIELTSPAFDDGGTIPERYARDGDDVFPPLRWSGVPGGTRQLALSVEDPDAPDGTFVHWVVAGLDAELDRLESGELPETAVEGRNDFGDVGYGGPQPPEGDDAHRYVFTLSALDDDVRFEPGAEPRTFHDALQGKVIATGQLTGRFAR
jgi:Raf kinase inhibitor-like YbhB/YbcL family protein